ncbi:peptide methionine sulfoxide reductase [Pseudozyma hubeiensis SY62]|uniref:Peptide methionine sulfoxide reductase n=1 Tax=Pseudozyma hubeiensis (strain SY62) TaxID=1305764 RepID=R9NWP4_PSEHS|nr:peptide methionine sulfoxide reductase [Pseudozyma hubeiensis SY62]GAC92936.1 peptide methionine sulfoxide reductase [Pseudozyma hubeiensis SY62]
MFITSDRGEGDGPGPGPGCLHRSLAASSMAEEVCNFAGQRRATDSARALDHRRIRVQKDFHAWQQSYLVKTLRFLRRPNHSKPDEN